METEHTFTVAYVPRGPSDIIDNPRVFREVKLRWPSQDVVGEEGAYVNATSRLANTCHQHHINSLQGSPLLSTLAFYIHDFYNVLVDNLIVSSPICLYHGVPSVHFSYFEP